MGAKKTSAQPAEARQGAASMVAALLMLLCCLCRCAQPAGALAGVLEDIGYADLQKEAGEDLEDGTGVPVGHVEAGSSGRWRTDPADPEFFGKRFHFISDDNGGFSGHSTSVGRLFYGIRSSIAPGIQDIDCYEAGSWMGPDFLRSGSPEPPRYARSRVWNHSWVGGSGDFADILRRTDWVVEKDQVIVVAASRLPNKPVLGACFNAVRVGRTAGEQPAGDPVEGGLYERGSSSPDLVVPEKNLSRATPVVSAAAVLLAGLAANSPHLSSDPVASRVKNRFGAVVMNGGRPEVIKAALMAGAERLTENTTEWDIKDYRGRDEHRASNGLDPRFGAGQLNIRESYRLLSAGEQNSLEDDPPARGLIKSRGFDYDPAFGGVGVTNRKGSYTLPEIGRPVRLIACLAWNLDVSGGSVLHDLDLFLLDITDSGEGTAVASSAAPDENTENLWVELDPGRKYRLEVRPGAGEEDDFKWSYGLAWRVEEED